MTKPYLRDKIKIITEDDLMTLREFIKDDRFFNININNYRQLDRFIQDMVHTLEQRYPRKDADDMKKFLEETREVRSCDNAAENLKNMLQILDDSKYPNEFKCLLLDEMLYKIYDVENDESINGTEIEVKHNNKGMISLDKDEIDYIFKNAKLYDNFKELYLDTKIISKSMKNYQKIENPKEIDYNIQTSQGKWVKTNELGYHELYYMFRDTKYRGIVGKLEDLPKNENYIFVDNDGKPQMIINRTLKLVCDVTENSEINLIQEKLEFLTRNIGTKLVTQDLLDKVLAELNMANLSQKIKDGTFDKTDIPNLIDNLIIFLSPGFLLNASEYTKNLHKTVCAQLEPIKPMLAEYFDVQEDEIYIGNINLTKEKNLIKRAKNFTLNHLNYQQHKSPIKIVIGNVDTGEANDEIIDIEIGKVEQIMGDASIGWAASNSKEQLLKNLKKIKGSLYVNISLLGLEEVGKDLSVASIENSIRLPKLKTVRGGLHIKNERRNLVEINEIENVNGFIYIYFNNYNKSANKIGKISLLGLKTVNKDLYFSCDSKSTGVLYLNNLESVNGSVSTSVNNGHLSVNIDKLKYIGGDAKNVYHHLKDTKVDGMLIINSINTFSLNLSKIDVTLVTDQNNQVITKQKYQNIYMAKHSHSAENYMDINAWTNRTEWIK